MIIMYLSTLNKVGNFCTKHQQHPYPSPSKKHKTKEKEETKR